MKYPNLLERGVAGIFGLLVVLVAFWVRRRSMIAWKAIAYLLPIGWVFFVIGSTLSGASAYANPSKRDTLIMGGIIGILSFPVMLYWERRWLKQKDQFRRQLTRPAARSSNPTLCEPGFGASLALVAAKPSLAGSLRA